ncbi:hypothetical protein P8452_32928 [Trifolium repens]|nr:hypothetical protein P8452_32928 [Trifolium repens]
MPIMIAPAALQKLAHHEGIVRSNSLVTLGPKGKNVVLHNKYGPSKIVNDGETVLKEVIAAGNESCPNCSRD